MTVNTTNITSGPYTGNGIADTFSYTFKVDNKNQLSVYETDAYGGETLLVVDTDYTVSGIGNDGGGNITRVFGPLAEGSTWFIRSNYQETQEIAFESQGAFFPEIHEQAMDKLTFLIQQIIDEKSRSPAVSNSYSGTLPLTLDNPSAGQMLQWNAEETGLENVDADSILDAAISGVGYNIIGDFADVEKVTVTEDNQVYTSKTLPDYEDALWRTTQELPYTPTGSDPTSGDEEGKWVLVSIGELKTIARAFNVTDAAVIYSTDTVTVLDNVEYIHDATVQTTWKIPTIAGTGEYLVSVVGNQLTTSSGTYTLTVASELSWGNVSSSTPNGQVLEPFELWLVDTADGIKTRPLPLDPPDGMEVCVRDKAGLAGTNTITIGRNGNTIETFSEDMTITTNWSWVRLRYIGSESTWRVIGGGVGAQVRVITEDLLDAIYPVGYVLLSRNANNPSTYFGGTWVAASVGKYIAGVGISTDMNGVQKQIAAGDNLGEWAHVQTEAEVGSHNSGAGLPPDANTDPQYPNGEGDLVFGTKHTQGEEEDFTETKTSLNQAQENVEAMNIANPSDGFYVWERVL